MYNAKAYSASSATSPLAPTTIARRDPTESDVQIEILFCGICHSDLHQARNEWKEVMPTVYPCVPGHEIVGRVVQVGEAVVRFGGHVGRCLITSRDPDSGVVDLPTLDLLRAYRGDADTTAPLPFGIYGEVLEGGPVRVGDPVSLLEQ
jgi:hypothetical protein